MRYLRQALAMMREEKLYSAMYICGTALAIAFTMLIAEVYYVKTADIAPEVNRSKTYYLEYMLPKNDDNNATMIYWDNFRDLFQKMQTPESVTAVMNYWLSDGYYIKLSDGRHDKAVKPKVTEPGVWFFRMASALSSTSRRRYSGYSSRVESSGAT